MDIIQLIEKWKELYSVYDEGSENKWFSDIRTLNETISLAIKLDETYVTAAMILRNSISDYLSGKEFSFKELFKNRKRLFKVMDIYDELSKMLESNELRFIIEQFKSNLRNNITNSGFAIDKKLGKLLSDEYSLAVLRLSALKAFNELRVDQFSKGQRTSHKDMKVKGVVLKFSDINILLRAMKSKETQDGVYLSLIEDVENYNFSFFVFAIKNGNNIWVTSDKPEFPQPNYRHSGRGRAIERGFSERVEAHYFPYELLVEYDKDKEKYIKLNRQSYEKAVDEYHGNWGILGSLDDCDVTSKLWVFMVLGLYQHKFFVSDTLPEKEELSYTNLMVEVGNSEKGANNNSKDIVQHIPNSLISDYGKLSLPITSTKISADETLDLWEDDPVGHNAWIEERYAAKISDVNVQSLLRSPNENLQISAKSGKIISNPKERSWLDDRKNKTLAITVGDVRLSDFGTESEVSRNIRWQARYTKKQIVQELLNDEYERTEKSLYAWYRSALESNMERLKESIGKGEFISSRVTSQFDWGRTAPTDKNPNILKVSDGRKISYHAERMFFQGDYRKQYCYFTGQHVSLYANFTVNNANAIADVCGLTVEDLPDILQHFTKYIVYAGNSILDMKDPMDFIKNPFNENMDFDFTIFLSKRYYNKLVKEFGDGHQESQR